MAKVNLGRVGFVMQGAYDSNKTYKRLDCVTANNVTYSAKEDVPAGTPVTNTQYWQVVLDGQGIAQDVSQLKSDIVDMQTVVGMDAEMTYDMSVYDTILGIVSESGAWSNVGNANNITVLMTDIPMKLTVTASDTSARHTNVAFFNSVPTQPANNGTPIRNFCIGENGRHTINAGTTATFDVPADCKCIGVITKINGTDRTPKSIVGMVRPETGILHDVSELKDRVSRVEAADQCLVKYEQSTTPEFSAEQLSIYLPTTVGYIKHQFVHSVNADRNADNWRMGIAYAAADDLSERYPITAAAEWECAVHLADRSDFSGGIAHGDEIGTSLTVMLDGRIVPVNSITSLTSFDELRVITTSNLYDPADGTTLIATHGAERIYTKDGVTVNQSLKWEKAVTATACYLAMFPPSKTVTDHFYTENDFAPAVIPARTQVRRAGAHRAVVYSEEAGFVGEFSVEAYPVGYSGGDYFLMLDNGGTSYNKCYYAITKSDGDRQYEIEKDTLWRSQTVYRMTVAK